MTPTLLVCWTTLPDRESATNIADNLVTERLASCVQIDGPIASIYRWKDQIEHDQEYRVWIKCLPAMADKIEKRVMELHPYDTPQWIAMPCEKVGEKYLKWSEEVSNLRGFL